MLVKNGNESNLWAGLAKSLAIVFIPFIFRLVCHENFSRRTEKMKKKTTSKKTRQTKKTPSLGLLLKKEVVKLGQQIGDLLPLEAQDIVAAIKQDHDSLRNYLGILKDTEKDMTERRRAYKAFAALLKSHSVSEEKAVYRPTADLAGREMHIKVAEGYVEHHVADDLMARIERTKDPMTWSAHANVLSENIEHHLKEEERDLLPLIRKTASAKKNMDMLAQFLFLRGQSQKKVTAKNAGVLKSVRG